VEERIEVAAVAPTFPDDGDEEIDLLERERRLQSISEENARLAEIVLQARRRLGKSKQRLELSCMQFDSEGRCTRRSLDRTFMKLRAVLTKRASSPVRFSQFGDSLTSGDGLTGVMRARMQEIFGDGGYGFVPPAPPRPYMVHKGVRVATSGQWAIDTFFEPDAPDHLGLMGAAFTHPKKARLDLWMVKKDRGHGRIGILYASHAIQAQDTLDILADERPSHLVLPHTGGHPRVQWLELGRDAREVQISYLGGSATHYGVAFERGGPGVVVDNLGMINASARSIKRIDPLHWERQLTERGTDVAAFFYGPNQATLSKLKPHALRRYAKDYGAVLAAAKGSEHERDCLVISILTRGRKKRGVPAARASVRQIAETQRDVSAEHGCAFFNAFEFMGAEDGPRRWTQRTPKWLGSDMVHPTYRGYSVLGRALTASVLASFERWLLYTPPELIEQWCVEQGDETCATEE
ncbi:MAG: hypothetical protein AAGI01_06175, partial [Myxococcota bacterium]